MPAEPPGDPAGAPDGCDLVGSVIDGAWRVEALVGTGAMARVFRVLELPTSRVLAMKVLAPQLRQDPSLNARFRREFDACSSIEHPNVIRLHRLGALPDGSRYFLMDYLPYPSLAEVLLACGRLAPLRALPLLLQAADGLAAVHAHGVVHRDLKPANVLVGGGDRLVLVDFGLAHDDTRTRLTQTGTVLGTPQYMAPESLLGEPADPRSDLYALGIVAFELLTGRRPFEARDVGSLITRMLTEGPPSLAAAVPGISPSWQPVIERCLAKDKDARYPSAAALRASLQALLDESVRGLGAVSCATGPVVVSTPLAVQPATPPATPRPAPSLPPTEPPAQPGRPRRVPAALVAGLAAAGLGATACFWALRAGPGTGAGSPDVVRGLEVLSEPGAVDVRWSTERPCPSRVFVDGRREPFEGQVGQAVTSHAVTVAPLDDGATCTFRLLLPSGDLSLPRTATAKPLRVEGLAALAVAGGSVEVRWRCRAPEGATAELWLLAPGRTPAGVPARREGEDGWLASLPELEPSTEGLEVRLGTGRVVSLAALLRAELAACSRPISALAAPALLDFVSAESSRRIPALLEGLRRERGPHAPPPEFDEVKELRRAVEGPLFNDELQRRGIPLAFERLAGLSRLVFGTALLSPAEVEAAYQVLCAAARLEGYSRASRYTPGLSLGRRPWLGEFARYPTATDAPDVVVPATLPALCKLAPARSLVFEGVVPSVTLEVTLPSLEGVAAAELVLEAAHFNTFALKVRVNDRLDLWLTEERPIEPSRRFVVAQRLPVRALRPGRNVLEVTAERYFDHWSSWKTTLYGARLALWRSPPAQR